MDRFLREIEVGEIHARDRWQFELKSDFYPHPSLNKHTYTQEFYFFIPNALQINQETYSKSQFYRDQTNLIRYKTPEFTFRTLLDVNQSTSPLNRIKKMCKKEQTEETQSQIEDELKLFANIVRSSLRVRVHHILKTAPSGNWEIISHDTALFCNELQILRKELIELKKKPQIPSSHFAYIDEFISESITYYLTGLLRHLRKKSLEKGSEIDSGISNILIEEQKYRKEKPSKESEFILYRKGLLNKFILDALLLNINRFSLAKTYRNLIGAFSAGIAMFIYLLLFIWQGEWFLMNSEPFILFTVIIYILKDRLKEGLKSLSYRKTIRWFSDYTTEIRSPNEKQILGTLKESFSIVDPKTLPNEITQIRNQEFHTLVDTFIRPENVIFYKKEFQIVQPSEIKASRRGDFNIIFRFNLHHFLFKASEPTHTHYNFDEATKNFQSRKLPKVYHINIILRNVFTEKDLTEKIELKKFRLIVDKTGIKRVEHLK